MLGRLKIAFEIVVDFLKFYFDDFDFLNIYVYNRVITGNSGVIPLQSVIPLFALCSLLFGWCSITSYSLLITIVNSFLLKESA